MIHTLRMRSWMLLTFVLCFGVGHMSVGNATPSMKVSSAQNPRQVISLNRDWRFTKGDVEQAADPSFDDSNWQPVHVPHDWAIAGPFNPQENGYAGKLPWKGVGWYRKCFRLKRSDAGRRVYLDFDGVMAFPQVYVNGKLAGTWDYGYMAFRIDATDYVRFGRENLIAVRVDTRQQGTRWYPGAGIYRKVSMTLTHPVHIAHWGSFVTTPEVSDGSATIRVKTTLVNHFPEETACGLEVMIQDPDGATLAVVETSKFIVPAGAGSCEMSSTAVIPDPQRWDLDKPTLYRVVTTLRQGGQVVDVDTVSFGIRSFAFTANDGFHGLVGYPGRGIPAHADRPLRGRGIRVDGLRLPG